MIPHYLTKYSHALTTRWSRRISRLAPLFAFILVLASAQAAIFNGQPVSITWYNPDLSTLYQPTATATVGAGVEFQNYATANPAFNVDFTDNTIHCCPKQWAAM